jgi:hypothetical protein
MRLAERPPAVQEPQHIDFAPDSGSDGQQQKTGPAAMTYFEYFIHIVLPTTASTLLLMSVFFMLVRYLDRRAKNKAETGGQL